ncbi:MAG: type II toxin-antitoxin system RelE/ParE family toxin [Anaeroplasmataceae bacterium]
MIYNYEFTKLAINDIDETLNYITNKLCNKKAADDLMKDIEKCIQNICIFPMGYPNCKYFYIKDESIRYAVINNYILVYKIFKSKIIFIRFKYSKQNKIL